MAAVLHDIIIVNSEITMHVIVCDLLQYMLTYLQYCYAEANRSYCSSVAVGPICSWNHTYVYYVLCHLDFMH